MSALADANDPPAELMFWLTLVRTRAAALLHWLADGPRGRVPDGRSAP